MKRPKLNEIPLRDAMAGILEGGGGLFVTMSPGQWDALLSTAYDTGATLLEIDDKEQPVRAYQRRIEGQAENPFPFDGICGRCITEAEARKAYPLAYKKRKVRNHDF